MIDHQEEQRGSRPFPLREQGALQPSELLLAWRKSPIVLLSGETGTGKTYLTRRLHAQSAPPLFLRELHCRLDAAAIEKFFDDGDAEARRQLNMAPCSRTIQASASSPEPLRPTLLLREIEVLSERKQLRLMRHLERAADLFPWRLVLTTRCPVRSGAGTSGLRDDLFFRLVTFGHCVSPLRERGAEIWRLARHFVTRYAERYRKRIDRIETGFSRQLLEYRWPGNVRELKHVIERAVIHCEDGRLGTEHLPPWLRGDDQATGAHTLAPSDRRPMMAENSAVPSLGEESLERSVADVERVEIEQALRRNLQSRTHAARELGISRVTLYNKMKKLGIETLKH